MENPDIYSSDDESSKNEDEKNANDESDNESSEIDDNLEENDDIEYEDTSGSDVDIDDEDEENNMENEDENNIDNTLEDDSVIKEQKKNAPNKKEKAKRKPRKKEEEEEEEDDDDEEIDNENYLQKFDENLKDKIIQDYHPELHQHNYEEIESLTKVVRDETGVIIDPFHKTIPFLTKYEKAKIIGSRAMQIASGGKPFIQLESNVIDSYLIAMEELKQKKIPFIIKRPYPNGNGCEYWKLKDLEILE